MQRRRRPSVDPQMLLFPHGLCCCCCSAAEWVEKGRRKERLKVYKSWKSLTGRGGNGIGGFGAAGSQYNAAGLQRYRVACQTSYYCEGRNLFEVFFLNSTLHQHLTKAENVQIDWYKEATMIQASKDVAVHPTHLQRSRSNISHNERTDNDAFIFLSWPKGTDRLLMSLSEVRLCFSAVHFLDAQL